jgi:Zn-dependent protease
MAMPLYISKNGKQLGPYSMPDVMSFVRSGTLVETDWVWYEGLPNWIPLNQVPGYNPAAPPPPPPPPAIAGYSQPVVGAKKSIFQKIGGGIAAVAYGAFKFKAFAFAGLKTSLSMLLMIWIYSWTFGWEFAVGFIFLIFVHEMGHVVAAMWLGMPVSAPLFIPFVGAFITMKQNPRDAWTEALMAYGGPLAGCVGSWLCLGAGLFFDVKWVVAVASASFVINLFNMIPVPPMDGGRICAAISTWFWLVGIVMLGIALFYFHSVQTVVVIAIIVIFGTLPRLKQTFFGQTAPEMQAYYATNLSNRLIMAAMFLGLLAALLLGYWDASMHLAYLWDNS